ncbi:hypothetical protein ILUMI_26453 [Ignelater luminosus]|uniref:Uncharacterized protein n=1 Tax=Ignelater luminosus TaxID=2038154 RepID=A0A8K0FZ39_IGNLU|nr:hypothetical protein ILUMI_26453 [Ignelater luminosus]
MDKLRKVFTVQEGDEFIANPLDIIAVLPHAVTRNIDESVTYISKKVIDVGSSDVVTPKVINTVSNLITENRRISYRQIEDTLAINASSVHKILHEHLKVRKVCTLGVPHALTVEQMACRVVWCKNMLKNYANGAPRYLNNFVTGDKTWLYYYDVRSKRKNQVWLFENEETPTEIVPPNVIIATIKACAAENNVDAKVVKKAYDDNDFPDDGNFKCFYKCYFKKMTMLNDDGSINETVIKSLKLSDVNKAKVEALVNKYKGNAGADVCQVAYEFGKCFREVYGPTMKRGKLLVSLALKANNGEDDNVEASAIPSLSDTGGISDISPCPDAFPINSDLDLSLDSDDSIKEKDYYYEPDENSDGISTKRVNTALCKMRNLSVPDKRGVAGGHSKISEEQRTTVINHINKFPRYISHYCRATRNNQGFLSIGMTVTLMYKLYTEENPTHVSLSA